MFKRSIILKFAPLISILLLILIWWFFTELKLINPLFLPNLKAMFLAFGNILSSNETYYNLSLTIYRSAVGLFISSIVGIPLGLIFGKFDAIYRFFEGPTEFFRAIPSSALFPLFILFFGIGDASKIGIVFYGCSLIIMINTIYGVKPTREKIDRINMLKSFNATSIQIFQHAIIKDALPHIASGIRVSISLSYVLVIVTEMFLGAQNGLGRQIYDYYLQYYIAEMYCVIIILGIIGYFSNKIFIELENKILFWNEIKK